MDLAGDAEVIKLTVREDAPITELTLREADADGLIQEEMLIVAVERDGEIVSPHGETTIRAEDVITVFVHGGQSERIESVFAPREV